MKLNEKYLTWEDKKGNKIKVCDMPDDYIVNCMNMITKSYQPDKYDNVFIIEWVLVHGQKYLSVFSKELEKRLFNRTLVGRKRRKGGNKL